MNFGLIADLQTELAAHFRVAELVIRAELCPADQDGDITINCFRFAKSLKANPMAVTQQVVAFCTAHADVDVVTAVKAFVNVTLTGAALFRDTVADGERVLAACALPEDLRGRILTEYSAPNTNKPQHLGHVRNNVIGMAVCGMLQRVGHTVAKVNLINDRGIHICKSMIAYQRFGSGCTPASTGRKGDHLVGDFYVRFDQELKQQLAALRAAQPAPADQSDDDLFSETEIGRAAQEMLIAWEGGDPEVRALWQQLNSWVLAGFDETYARIGAKFDKVYYESDTYTLGRDIVRDGLDRGVFYQRDDGAIEIDLNDLNLGTKVVLRSDGTSVYVTQDIGTTLLKFQDFDPQRMIWVVGDEQIYHFRVLFAILERLGYEWAARSQHLAYGMVHLPSGKMKSREGTVVDADNLFDDMVNLAKLTTREKWGDEIPDLDHRAHVIGMAAIKFMLLKVSPKTTMTFDPAAAIKFEGDTGPFILFNYARTSSLLRKQTDHDLDAAVDWSLLGEAEERQTALLCARYGEIMQRAAEELDAAILAGYLLDLAREFSRFYNKHSVLSAESAALRRTRLELCCRVRDVLRDGLTTLGLDVLEEM